MRTRIGLRRGYGRLNARRSDVLRPWLAIPVPELAIGLGYQPAGLFMTSPPRWWWSASCTVPCAARV